MKTQKITCKEARNISILPVLNNLGYLPKKQTEKQAWFISPFRKENTASFKVDISLNRWYDHGEGFGGNIIDLITKLQNCTIKEALEFLNNKESFSFQEQITAINRPIVNQEKVYTLKKVKPLENKALIEYLASRKINIEIAKTYCKEIYYSVDDKNYFSIGFKNVKEGFEHRNKYFKGCIGNKSISWIKNGSFKLNVFEGFFDFLSYLTLYNTIEEKEDFLILNSVGLTKSIPAEQILNYVGIHGYLDNDEAGNRATAVIKQKAPNFVDCRSFYKDCKDLNEYLKNLETKEQTKCI